ncbi:MAG: TetR/AcrR family transcriptional regulator [Pseudomonadales bacterium]|nr:TetR/AcrR family transcriptional regulator [Pseudomonadales bacterium]
MSCAEHRAYHHGDLRQTLLEAAVRHIRAEGTEGLSLRALAREAGVSPTAPYRHFENRQALLAALATEGFRELDEVIGAAVVAGADPVTQVFLVGVSYVEYARTHPVKYHMMFGDLIGDFSPFAELREAAEGSYRKMERVLEAGLAAGLLKPCPLAELGGNTWAMVHGIAGLVIAAQRRSEAFPGEILDTIRPMQAQHRVLEAPERAVARLMLGLVADPDAARALERRAGLT